jgi:preprotein translocase subunit YajC
MFFESVAYAMGAAPQNGGQSGNPIAAFAPLILMFLIFYFLLIRPQQKKAKEHKALLSNLKKGDSIMTSGGIYGRIVALTDDALTIDVGNDVQIKVNRSFVSGLTELPKENKKGKAEKSEKQ